MARYSYLSETEAVDISLLPRIVFEDISARDPDWSRKVLENISAGTLDSRLAKRYAVPFDLADPPAKVREWVSAIYDWSACLKRGVDITAEHWPAIEARYTAAVAEIREAADAKDGLFDLPLRDGDVSAISRAEPLGSATDAYGFSVMD